MRSPPLHLQVRMTYMVIMSRNGHGEAYLAQFKTEVDGEKQKKQRAK